MRGLRGVGGGRGTWQDRKGMKKPSLDVIEVGKNFLFLLVHRSTLGTGMAVLRGQGGNIVVLWGQGGGMVALLGQGRGIVVLREQGKAS